MCASESDDTSSTPTSSAGFFSGGASSSSTTTLHSNGAGHVQQVVFIRRPSPLLKSPSVDSESSDPVTLPNAAATSIAPSSSSGAGLPGNMVGFATHKKMAQAQVLRRIHEKGTLLVAYRYLESNPTN